MCYRPLADRERAFARVLEYLGKCQALDSIHVAQGRDGKPVTRNAWLHKYIDHRKRRPQPARVGDEHRARPAEIVDQLRQPPRQSGVVDGA